MNNLLPTQRPPMSEDLAWALSVNPATATDDMLGTAAATIMKEHFGQTSLDGRIISGERQRALGGREYYAKVRKAYDTGSVAAWMEQYDIDFNDAETRGDKAAMRKIAREHIQGEGVGSDARAAVDKYDNFGGDSFKSDAERNKRMKEEFDSIRYAISDEDWGEIEKYFGTESEFGWGTERDDFFRREEEHFRARKSLEDQIATKEAAGLDASREYAQIEQMDAEYAELAARQSKLQELTDASRDKVEGIRRKYYDTIRDERRVATFRSQMTERNQWAYLASLKGHISEGAERVLDMALASGENVVSPAVLAEFEKLSTPEQRSISGALQMLHYGRDKNFVEFMRDLGTSFADTLGMVTVGAIRGAADSVRRMAMDSNEYRDMVERRAMLEDINRDRMVDWGYLGQSVIGVASTIPYMAAAAIPYVGMADMILSAKDQFQTEAARNGVDVASWDYQVGSAAFSIAYAFVEKIQWEKAFGGVSSIPRRQMYCDAFHSLRPTLAMGGSIAGTMLTESGEEGIQKALENVVETWGLGKDVAGEAIGGFVEDFVGSLGTMAIIGGFGAAKQKIAYRHGAVGFSKEEQMAAVSRMEDMANHYEGGTATAKEIGSFEREFGRVAEDWIASGRSAPSLRRWGFTSEQADAIGASLSRLWSAVQTQSKTDEERQRREKELFGGRVLTPAEAAARIQNKSYRGKVETDQKTGAQSTELDVGGVKIRVVVDPARVSSAVDPEDAPQHESIVNALNARSGGNMTVEAFRSLTPEERRGLVEDNKLQAQGDVHFYAPDGTEINGRALAAIVGNVSMTDTALPQTVWHETMHGVLRVVNQLASSGNEEAKALIAALVDAGYAPLSERETVNEEALSDAFQRVMSRRVDVVEHDGVLDRLGRFIARLFGYGTGRADPLKGAHSAQARLFNAAITGNLPAAIRQEESGAAEDDDPVFSMTEPILRRIESAAPKVEVPPPDEAGETAEKPESVGETVAKFRAREPLTKEQMTSLAAADEEFTTRLAWDNGYRWNETDGEWQFDEKLERRTDERDLPQTAYMGVDGQMHEPAAERHQIVGESGWAWTGSDMAGEAKRLEQSGADRETIWKRTGWWRGGDGKWRIEIPDIPQSEFGNILAFLRMGLRSSKTEDAAGKYFGTTLSKLGTVSNHLDRILMAYPGLNDVYVFLRDGKTTKEGHKGATYFSRTKKTEAGEPKPVYIEFGVKRRPEAIRSTFVHELQHAIQAMEGFDNGGNRDGDTLSPNERNDGKGYEDIPGEIEARLVQTRMEMSPEERSETPPWETERLMLERAKETGDSWSLMKEYREKRMANEARHQIIGPAGASRLGLRSANDAEEMERSGASRLDIWHETGWWKGVDGKWRIEIPDIELDDSTVDELIDALDYGENPYVQQLTDLVRSPRLFRAYKDLAYLGVEFAALPDGEYGNYVPGGDRITVNISLLKNRDELRGTLAHEIQHAVQAAEGFSKGGNEQEFTPLDSESFRRAAKTSRANAAFLRRQAENWKDFQEDSYKRAVEKNLKEAEEYDRKAAAAEARADEIDENALNGSVEVDGDVYENQSDAYQHIAGEAEARLVMKRLGMTPEERAARPPWEDLDVEENRQIVRYSIVTDQSVIDEFDDPDKFVYLYRAVKVGPDGAIRPPQSSQEMGPDGKYRDREPEGYLQPDGRITKNADGTGGTPTLMAEERPDLATTKPTADGSDVIRFTERDVKAGKATPDMVGQPKYYFDLKKGRAFNPATGREEDMGALEAVLYDPYGHFSDTPLNDQFATAWKRPDWRVIRVKVLKSDIESGYRAEKAALTVGPHPWNGGTVDSQLPDGLKRNVTLARYWQDDSLVPESEAADILEQKWGGLKKSLQIEDTRISPAMADEMRKRGFSIVETGRVKYAPRHSVSPEFAQDGTVVDSLPAHLREDGRAIVAERANTPEWMTDPDGTPTDLSERDWLRREAERAHDLRLGRLTPQEADELAELEALRESLDDLGEIDFRESPDYERGVKRLAELERKYGASRHSISGIYTGSGADYANRSRRGGRLDGPSLHFVGTGDGEQAYGWGLYGTGNAASGAAYADWGGGYLYEQTFFTNRPKGDVSHLLNWYEPAPRKLWDDAVAILHEAGVKITKEEDGFVQIDKDGVLVGDRYTNPKTGAVISAGNIYDMLSYALPGEAKEASERLLGKDWDGVMYPDNTGSDYKLLNGQTADNPDGRNGWNFVAFSDDNIRVDHKWVDGVQRYSVTPAEDAAYMDAVNRGDMETAQRMVREAAARAFQDTKVVDEDGLPKVLYHGGGFSGTTVRGRNGMFWLSDSPEEAAFYNEKGKATKRFFLLTSEIVEYDAKGNPYWNIMGEPFSEEEIDNGPELWDKSKIRYTEDLIRIRHKDGDIVMVKNVRGGTDEINTFYVVVGNTAAVKSADPVTYDDAGNVIPLSQRFNPASEDIRYQISGAVGAEALGIRGLADAEAMERSGASRLDIWRETGWWRGRDGEWRVEIPDFELNADAPRMLLANGTAHLADLIPPDSAILRAYPSLGKMRINMVESQSFSGRNNGISIDIDRGELSSPDKLRSTLAHELQHSLQTIEGFARGGSWDEQVAGRDANDLRRLTKDRNMLKRILAAIEDQQPPSLYEFQIQRLGVSWNYSVVRNALDEKNREIREMRKSGVRSTIGKTGYNNLAGEAEARLVEKRFNMTPEERAARPPWEDFDVAEADQIVRGQIARTESVKAPSAAQGITRFSVQSGITAAGFSFERTEDGPFRIVLPDGAVVSRKRRVTADDILGQDSMLTHVMALGVRHGTLSRKARKRLAETFANCFNLVAEWGDRRDGASVVDAAWKLAGDVAFKAAKSNSDKQYLTSVDMLTICKKVDMVVQVLSNYMVKTGRGVMPTDVMALYKATGEMGFQTPCPVCYVFSRWIRGGYDRQTIAEGQRLFAGEVRAHDPNTDEGKKYWRARYEELFVPAKKEDFSSDPAVLERQKARVAEISDAKASLNLGYQTFDSLMLSAQRARAAGDEEAAARFEEMAADANERIRAAFDAVRTSDLAGYIKYCIFDPDTGRVWKDFAVAPDDVVFDLRAAGEIARHYPGIKRFIKSKGSAGGKAIETEAENDVGDIVSGIASDGKLEAYELWSEEYERDLLERSQERDPETNKKTAAANAAAAKYNARNWLKVAYALPAGSKERKEALKKFDTQFKTALAKSARQRLRGGQRFFSWSDNRTEFGFDMMMNLAQIQMLGDSIQSYSKQLEGAELLAAHGAYNNGSLMASGGGLEDAKPGEEGATKIGGRWVKLKFSDVQGIAHNPLFELNKKYDKSGNILVGMNDDHIVAALRDKRIFFVIPWHASGLGRELLDYMLEILKEPAAGSETDYSPVQEDKWLKPKQVDAELVAGVWDRAKAGAKKLKSCFPVSHEAGKITQSQERYRDLRGRIMSGRDLTQADIDLALKDEFLSQLVRSLAAAAERIGGESAGVTYVSSGLKDAAGKPISLLKMTKDDVGAIYPYEYWDKKTTYGTSAVNSARYLEYCRRLGVLPKFCGIVASDKGSRRLTDKSGKPYGDFTAEPMYWQLLVDRRMYANGRNADGSWKDFESGKYQDTDQVEAVTDARPFNVDLIDPNKVEKKWGKLITKKAEPKAVGRIVDSVLAKQRREGYSLADGSRHSVAPSDPSLEDAAGQADAAEREIEETTRHAMSWGGPAFSYRSYAEALAARDDAMGIKRPDEDYARILTALGIDGEVDVADLRKAAAELRADIKGASDTIVDLAAKAEQKRFARTVSSLVSGAAEMGIEVGGNARRAWEKYLSEMRRLATGREYGDFYSDMRLDLARLLLAITPEDFDEKKAGEEDGKTESAADAEAREIEDILSAMDEDGADMEALRKRIAELAEKRMDEIDSLRERIRARLDEWRAAEAERRRRAEENAAKNPPKENDETEEDFDEEGNDTDGGEKRLEEYENESVESLEDFRAFVESLKSDGMDLSNAGEFAALIRIYVEDWLARQQGDDADPRTILSDPVNAARYRRTVVDILRDLCNKLLDPALGKASVTAERMLAEIPGDATAAEIQSRSRSIIAFVQRNAIRQSAKKMIADLRKNIKLLAIQGKRFDETEKDLGRKITGEREAYARYIYRILDWSDGRIAQEMQKLEDIISGRRAAYEAARGTDAALDDLATTDREIHRATERLNALQLWGGLRRKLPGEIALAAQNITQWLETERDQHERRWEAWKEKLDQEADELARAFTASQAEFTPDDPGWVGQMADALTTNFRMRLERLAAGSGAAGRRAIDMVMARIYEGSERLANVKAAQRARFDAVLAKCVEGTQMSVADFLKALDEKIPEELNRQLVTDAQRIRMTWGQALQLLGELEQTASYARNIEANGREGQRDLIVDALRDKPQMMRLVDELRAVYDENREALSAEFFAVTGNPILQPDPLYLPARMYTGARDNLETSVRAWNPFGPAFSPRVSNSLDFDLTASILDVFADRQRQTACALAFGVRGMELRSILARKEVQDAITRSHGKFPLRQMIAHLTDIVGDGYKDDTSGMKGYRKLVRTIGNVTTYSALSWNVVTMLKQMMSVPSWTAILDGGYTEIFHHICNFDAAAAKELCAEPGFVARYGATGFAKLFAQEVGNPQDGNLLSRLFKAGMTAVQIGDFVPGILVGTGVYKARKLVLMDQGMNEAAARKQAARETWGLIEENQQSSRLENTPEILRRGGFLGRQLSKFATSPFMQVAHEIHTLRMWQAEKRNAQRTGVPSEAEAVWRRKFYNQIVCNHVLMPAAFYAVANLFAMGLGGEPPEKDQVYGDLVMQMIAGPWSRIFILGMVADQTGEWAARAMGFKPNVYERGDLAATQYLSKAMKQIGRAGGDIADEDWESLRDDIVRMIGQVNTPFRYATKAVQNATGYDPAKERQRRKREIKKREAVE